MSDGVVVALITAAGGVVVAIVTAVLAQRKQSPPPTIHVSVPDRTADHRPGEPHTTHTPASVNSPVRQPAAAAVAERTVKKRVPLGEAIIGDWAANSSGHMIRAISFHTDSSCHFTFIDTRKDNQPVTHSGTFTTKGVIVHLKLKFPHPITSGLAEDAWTLEVAKCDEETLALAASSWRTKDGSGGGGSSWKAELRRV